MNNYEKILNYAKDNNGYITTKETESLEVNSFYDTIKAINKIIDILEYNLENVKH